MNEKRRGRLKDALKLLGNAVSIIESVCDEEQDAIDNYPENLQGSERFEGMEQILDRLYDVIESLESSKEHLETMTG